MIRRIWISVLLALLAAQPLAAEPMTTTLAKMVQRSRQIVVARYLGPESPKAIGSYRLEVLEVLKGAPTWTGLRIVGRAHGRPTVKLNARCVAFIDEQGRFHWAASPRAGFSLQTGPLLLEGFYDFNAYLVSPGIISLAQLRRYLQRPTRLSYRFKGPLLFWDPRARRPLPSSIVLTVTSDWVRGVATISGLPLAATQRWGKAPRVAINHLFARDLEVSLKRSWPGPLVLRGKIDGVDKAGFRAHFWVVMPLLLRKSDFDAYLAGRAISHSYSVLRLSRKGSAGAAPAARAARV